MAGSTHNAGGRTYEAVCGNARAGLPGTAGTVLEADTKNGLLVACGDGALRIMELQMVGGKRMAARKQLLRGHQIARGTKLGN